MSSYGTHRQDVTHWAPKPVEQSPYAACGRHIDGPCDEHERLQQPCHFGVAWTRSPDLANQGGPYDDWPPPCPSCAPDAALELARLAAAR